MAAIKIYERLGGWRCSDEREVDLMYPLFRPWSSCYGNVENLTEVGCLNLCSTNTLAWWGKTLPGAKQKDFVTCSLKPKVTYAVIKVTDTIIQLDTFLAVSLITVQNKSMDRISWEQKWTPTLSRSLLPGKKSYVPAGLLCNIVFPWCSRGFLR